MEQIFINHRIFQSYFILDDVITTKIYDKYGEFFGNYQFQVNGDRLILKIYCCKDVLIGFNIKSDSTCVGLLCINGIIISTFHVYKGDHFYPHLALLYGNWMNVILDECCVTEITMLCVDRSKCNLMKNID